MTDPRVRRLPAPPLTAAQRALASSPEALAMLGRVTSRAARRYGDYVSREDLAGAGKLALAEAARAYDPSIGAAFEVYAWSRVHGEMVELGEREREHANRARRGAYKLLDLARDEGDPWNDSEAQHREKLEELSDALVAAMLLGALGEATIASSRGPEAQVGRMEAYARAAAVLEKELASLPAPDPALLHMMYREDRTMLEASRELGMSYSTARRAHVLALSRLAKRLRAAGVLTPPSRPSGV